MENKEDDSPVSVVHFCPIDEVGRGDDLEVVKEKEEKEERGDFKTSRPEVTSELQVQSGEAIVQADDSMNVGLSDQTGVIEYWPGQKDAEARLPTKCLLEQKSDTKCFLKEKNATDDQLPEIVKFNAYLSEQNFEQESAMTVDRQKDAMEQLVDHKVATELLCEQNAATKLIQKHPNASEKWPELKSATEALPGQNPSHVGGTNGGEQALIQQDQNDNQYHSNYSQQPMMGHSSYGPPPPPPGAYGPPPQHHGGGMFGNTSGTMVCVIVYAIYFCIIVVPVSIFIAVSVYGYNDFEETRESNDDEFAASRERAQEEFNNF